MSRHLMCIAAALSLTGCGTNPYNFSKQLNTFPVSSTDKPLAGNLHLAMRGLMDQRDMLWTAASDTQQMQNLTALGLIGVGAVGLYKGLNSDLHQTWLRKAGLGAAAVYAGATWLEPNARQQIYLAGAMSLTCLALSTAPYEMTQESFDKEAANLAAAHGALEDLFSQLRLAGKPPAGTPEAAALNGAWRQAQFASKWLASADAALGSVEKVGPRLRDRTALTASEVAKQVSNVAHDLSQLQPALAALKPSANMLIGSDVFTIPSPPAADDPASPARDEAAPAAASVSCKAATPDTEKEADAKKAATAAGAAAGAAAAASAVTRAEAVAAGQKAGAAAGAAAGKKEADHAVSQAQRLLTQTRLDALSQALTALSRPLGQAISMTRRLQAAREAQQLPEACNAKTLTLFPSDRSIALQPGASFQYLLSGDEGRPGVQLMTVSPPPEVLDVAIPALQAGAAVRLTAGRQVPQQIDTIVRISDSKKTTHFDVNVRLCSGSS